MNNNNNMMNNMMINNMVNMNMMLMDMLAKQKNVPQNNNEEELIPLYFKRNKIEKDKEFRITITCFPNDLLDKVVDKYCFKTNEKKKIYYFLLILKD